ncbi:MAG: LamG domain-containing protein, partial [Akkermansiaceae bacterium]|nr:LamG domain-containing protein [Verrucomicrobiales bacterium]
MKYASYPTLRRLLRLKTLSPVAAFASKRWNLKKRAAIPALLIALTTFLAMPAPARADLDFTLSVTHGYDFYYPGVGLGVDPAPETYHRIESPSGLFWKNTGTNNDGNPFFITNNLNAVISEFTNGLWKFYSNKESASETVYFFKVSVTGLTTNVFGDIQIIYPVNGSSDVENQPTFHWTGPSNLPNLYLSAYNSPPNTTSYSVSPPSTTTNWTTSGTLANGDNELYISYNDYNFAGFVCSTPTNALGQTLPGWVLHPQIATYGFSFFSVTGSSITSSGHTNVAHYDFEENSVFATDLSGSGNDINGAASFGGGTAYTTNDAASGTYAAFFSNNGGTGAGWLTPPTNLLATLTRSFSVSVWLKTSQISGNDNDEGRFGNAGIISAFSGPGDNWVVPMSLTGSKLAFATGGGSPQTLHSSALINTGAYVHLAVTRDHFSGEKKIYINGQLDNTGMGSTAILDSSTALDIGYNNGVGLQGGLDDIQIYSGVLSASEVESLYNNPGTSISDISGNGTDFNTALENNFVWTTGGDAPWFTQSTTTYDGIDAAQSGMIGHDQYSLLETTVTGPGTLSFWWFVSSDDYDGYDRLEFSIDG